MNSKVILNDVRKCEESGTAVFDVTYQDFAKYAKYSQAGQYFVTVSFVNDILTDIDVEKSVKGLTNLTIYDGQAYDDIVAFVEDYLLHSPLS